MTIPALGVPSGRNRAYASPSSVSRTSGSGGVGCRMARRIANGEQRIANNARPVPVTTLSHVYPLGSQLSEQGRLQIGGCDAIELAREFGTPAYVYAEDDIRARARQYVEAFRTRTERFEVVYASKAFPCTAAYRLLAEEGLSCDVASGGELHLALAGGFRPERIY